MFCREVLKTSFYSLVRTTDESKLKNNTCLEDFELSRFDCIQPCRWLINKVSFREVLLVYVIGMKMTADVNACPTLSP